jgi:hypothetical protein
MIAELLLSGVVTAALLGALAFLFRSWILERLRASINHTYNSDLERIRSDLSLKNSREIEAAKASLAQEASKAALALQAIGANLQAYQSKRVEAIDALWRGLLAVREHTPAALTFLDVLTADEYRAGLESPQIRAFAETITESKIQDSVRKMPNGIEAHRLFAGEYLWSLYWLDLAVNMRAAVTVQQGVGKGALEPWWLDDYTARLIQSALDPSQMDRFRSLEVGRLAFVRQCIENRFMAAADTVLHGGAIGETAIRQAQEVMSKLRREDPGSSTPEARS